MTAREVDIILALNGTKLVGIKKQLTLYYEDKTINRITSNNFKKLQGHKAIFNKYDYLIENQKPKDRLRFYRFLFYQYLELDRFEALKMFQKIKENSNGILNFRLLIDWLLLKSSFWPWFILKIKKIKHTILLDK